MEMQIANVAVKITYLVAYSHIFIFSKLGPVRMFMLHSEIVQGCKDHYGEGDKVSSKLPLFSSCKVEVT